MEDCILLNNRLQRITYYTPHPHRIVAYGCSAEEACHLGRVYCAIHNILLPWRPQPVYATEAWMNIHIVSQPQCFPDGTPEKETWRVSHQTGKQKADSNFHPVLLDHVITRKLLPALI